MTTNGTTKLVSGIFLVLAFGMAWGQEFTSSMTPGHGTDTYAFAVTSDAAVTLVSTLSGTLNGGNAGFYIKAADRTTDIVRSGWAHPGATEGPWPLKAGTYYLTLWNNDSGTGTYRATVSMTPTPMSGDTEPNDSAAISVALPTNTQVSGHLGYYDGGGTDGYDWYRVTTTSAGSFSITTTSDSTMGPYFGVVMYLADATTVVRDTSAILPAGTYYLQMWANTYGYGGYTLRAGFASATAPAPALSLSASSLSFGSVQVAGTSPTQTVELRNSGNAPATLGAISASGDFAVNHNCPATLSAGASCALNVSFSPAAAGTRTGTLSIGGGTAGTISVALTGTGIAGSSTATWAITEYNHSSAQNVTLMLTFAPSPEDRNGTHNLYVAGIYAGQIYFVSLQNFQLTVVQYLGGGFPAYTSAAGAELRDPSGGMLTYAIPLGNLSSLRGLEIYAGFGRSADDMMAKGQVQRVFRVD